MSLSVDALKLKKIFEADPFDSADPDDVRIRAEADKLKYDEYKKDFRNRPKVPVYVMMTDQTSTDFDKAGDFWYDEDDDVYFDDEGDEIDSDVIADAYRDENYSTMVWVSVISKDRMKEMRDRLNSMFQEIERAENAQ